MQLARFGLSAEDRYRWLKRAADQRNPEALYMLAQRSMSTDLAMARRLLLDAAENGSRTAIIFISTQYLRGGVLFDQNGTSAENWLSALEKVSPSVEDPAHLTPEFIDHTLNQAKEMEVKIHANDVVTLYQQAKIFLRHPTKDQLLRDRTVDYLSRAAKQGHGEAALELARLAMLQNQSKELNDEALKWYKIAAEDDKLRALEKLSRYYKKSKTGTADMLQQSLDYNERLLQLLPAGDTTSRRLTLQHWSSEYRDTQKHLDQLKRLGGSWKIAIEQAGESSHKGYLLAKELLKDGQYAEGMKHLKSAAQRDSHQARYDLSLKTLRGPRSFAKEISAVSEIQAWTGKVC